METKIQNKKRVAATEKKRANSAFYSEDMLRYDERKRILNFR